MPSLLVDGVPSTWLTMAELRRRAEARKRQLDTCQTAQTKSTVLLNGDDLNKAVTLATQGGKKKLDGLYLPGGQKFEHVEDAAANRGVAPRNEEARNKQNLARVAKKYNEQKRSRAKRAHKDAKTQQELDDEESEKKAKVVLEKANHFERMQYEELFNFFDVDKDKTWGSIEFAQRMTDIGFTTSVEEASNLLYFAGVRDVDRITYNDFLAMMPKLKAYRRLLEKDALRVFAAKDKYGTGYLTLKQLREVIYTIAGPDGIDDKQVEQILKKSDRERTGRIPYDFFIRAFFGTPPVLDYKSRTRRSTWLQKFFGCGSKPAVGTLDDSDSDEDEDAR